MTSLIATTASSGTVEPVGRVFEIVQFIVAVQFAFVRFNNVDFIVALTEIHNGRSQFSLLLTIAHSVGCVYQG